MTDIPIREYLLAHVYPLPMSSPEVSGMCCWGWRAESDPLSHMFCTCPRWDWRGTYLAQVQKGSTLQGIFVFGYRKSRGNVQQMLVGWSHALLISLGIADW